MNKINFTHAGGFPLTQEELNFLQQAYISGLGALAQAYGDGPTVISGLQKTGSYSIASGWLWYNGELVYCAGGDLGMAPGIGYSLGFSVSLATENLTYADGSVFAAHELRTATWQAVASSGGAGIVLYTDLVPFGEDWGVQARETAWTEIVVPDAGVGLTGSLFYKRNFATNQLSVRVDINVGTISALTDVPTGTDIVLGTLPVGYCPGQSARGMLTLQTNSGKYAQLHTAGGYINSVYMSVDSSGDVTVNLPRVVATVFAVNGAMVLDLD